MGSNQDSLPPRFGLYGESADSLDPGFVHIEDIASRSRGLDWKIRPHRHTNLFQFLHLSDGEMQIDLENEPRQLHAPCSATIPVGVIHGFSFQPNTRGKVVSVATDLMQDETFANQFRRITSEPQLLQWDTQDEASSRFDTELNTLQRELDEALPGYETAMEWQVGRILIMLSRALYDSSMARNENGVGGSGIADQFVLLVDKHYAQHLKLEAYAAMLHLSLSSLHRQCIARFGQSPKQLIENRLIREAKRRLVYTQSNAEQIAYELGFKDPAYFTRFFKRSVGLAPSHYRQAYSRRK